MFVIIESFVVVDIRVHCTVRRRDRCTIFLAVRWRIGCIERRFGPKPVEPICLRKAPLRFLWYVLRLQPIPRAIHRAWVGVVTPLIRVVRSTRTRPGRHVLGRSLVWLLRVEGGSVMCRFRVHPFGVAWRSWSATMVILLIVRIGWDIGDSVIIHNALGSRNVPTAGGVVVSLLAIPSIGIHHSPVRPCDYCRVRSVSLILLGYVPVVGNEVIYLHNSSPAGCIHHWKHLRSQVRKGRPRG
jgi:hypothetical protein